MKYILYITIFILSCIFLIESNQTYSRVNIPENRDNSCDTEGISFENGKIFSNNTYYTDGTICHIDLCGIPTNYITDCIVTQLFDMKKAIFEALILTTFSIFYYGCLYILYKSNYSLLLNYHNNRFYKYLGLLFFCIITLLSYIIFNNTVYFTEVGSKWSGFHLDIELIISYYLFFQFYFFRKIIFRNISGISGYKEIMPSVYIVILLVLIASIIRGIFTFI